MSGQGSQQNTACKHHASWGMGMPCCHVLLLSKASIHRIGCAERAHNLHAPNSRQRRQVLWVHGLMLLVHTLDVIAQHLPVALGTALSKTFASLRRKRARRGHWRPEQDTWTCCTAHAAQHDPSMPLCALCWILPCVDPPFHVRTLRQPLQKCARRRGPVHTTALTGEFVVYSGTSTPPTMYT